METYAIYPGSCGEIIQGKINGRDMLISCPVNLFTKVRLFEYKNPEERFKYNKTSELLTNMLKRWGYAGLDKTFDITIESQIPMAKGFASSTADLCGLYLCLLKMFKRQYDLKEVLEEFIRIEPTDSIIFREMTLFDYKEGRKYKKLGQYIKFYILAFEGSRLVDTVSFNNEKHPSLAGLDDIMPWTCRAFEAGDISSIARASTISINRNLKRLPYPIHIEMEKLCSSTGGLGVIGGHSGDVLGIIYDDKEKLLYAANNFEISGYKPHMLETLRRNEYEGNYDNCTKQRQR